MENFERPPWETEEEAPRKRPIKRKMTVEQVQAKLLEWAAEAREKKTGEQIIKDCLF